MVVRKSEEPQSMNEPSWKILEVVDALQEVGFFITDSSL